MAKKVNPAANPAPDAQPRNKPKRPAHLAHGRWLGDFPKLSAAEKKLLAACAMGEPCRLGVARPEESDTAKTIRAGLIRFVALGGDLENPVHENGVQLYGAWISGELRLNSASSVARLRLVRCTFIGEIHAQDANLIVLNLEGSHIPKLNADRVQISGSLFLRKGFSSTGEIRLLGARIGGNLDCGGGSFGSADDKGHPRGDALIADRITTKSVLLGAGFSAIGEVRLLGAHISGNLDCSGGSFSNADKAGKAIGKALIIDGAEISDGLFVRNARFTGLIDLTTAHAGSLLDDRECWPKASLFLDGFRYDRIAESPTDADSRIDWLNRQTPDHLIKDFRPQPWEQLIKVLREMGHPYEASKLAMEKQRRWRKSWGIALWRPRAVFHAIYGIVAGYGYRPWWTVGWMTAVCFLCSLAYYAGRYDGLFGPTSPPIQLSKDLAAAGCGDGGTPGKIYWTSPECPMPPEYTSFQPFIYSLDVLLPFVDLQQENDWAPIVSNERGQPLIAGHLLRFLMWFEVLFGWLSSVLLAAVAGNLVKKD